MGVVVFQSRWVPQDVVKRLVDSGHPAAEPICRTAEHTFDRLRWASDGKTHGRAQRIAAYAADPSEDQMSTFVRMRSMTAVVKLVVPDEPPRSGVFIPDPTVSSAAS
jgi:hypothetical protein